MYEGDRNIYQIARKSAGFTQEKAAELLGISVESLRAYETGQRRPADDLVCGMADVYGTQFLAYQHLRSGQIACEVVPEISEVSIERATLKLVRRIGSFADAHRTDDLMSIAEDGVIDDEERVQFDNIVEELNGIIAAAMELRFAKR